MNECHDGEIDYIPGENYIKSNCTQQCTCSEDRFKGHLESCVPLCHCYLPNVCLELSQSYTKKMLSGATVNAANGDVSMVCTKI